MRQLAPGAVPSAQAVSAEAAGNKPAALQRWKTLLALLPADAPIRGMLEERIKAAGG